MVKVIDGISAATAAICRNITLSSHPQSKVNAALAILTVAECATDTVHEVRSAIAENLSDLIVQPLGGILRVMEVVELDKVQAFLAGAIDDWEYCCGGEAMRALQTKYYRQQH